MDDIATRCTGDTEHVASDTTRKDYYGAGKQPWDTMMEQGWAAGFAAGNVIKYLRRVKPGDEEHAIESAVRYYKWLYRLVWNNHPGAEQVLNSLIKELTPDESGKLLLNYERFAA